MDDPAAKQHLSRIETLWPLVEQAHRGSPEAVSTAQRELMVRYSNAVYSYLLGALRDPHAADDLFQEFCLRFVRGDFRRADPERGRFRDFVKTSLFHLIVDYQKRKEARHRPLSLQDVGADPAAAAPSASDEAFVQKWREELLRHTWEALARADEAGGRAYHRVLRYRAENPQLSSAEMAQRSTDWLGKQVTADWVRQTLRRAREQFADLLLNELARSLEDSSRERLEQELIDLGLLSYCQDALERRGAP